MRTTIYLCALVLLVCLGSCGRTTTSGTSGMHVTGKVGEILVVCETGIWNSEIKEHLDTTLTQWILPYLPDVATFQLIHKTPTHFTQGVKRYRNTLFIEIDPNLKGENGSITRKNDVWANGQLVIEVKAKDYNQLLETCKMGMLAVHDQFDDMSWRRIMDNFEKNKSSQARKQVQENFGIDIALPTGSAAVTRRKNFYRIEFSPASRPIEFVGTGTQDVGTILSGIMVYQYDYKDSAQFEFQRLLNARDTMLKYNVPSEVEGMYMGTQYNQIVYPEGNIAYSSDGKIKGFEMRGMFVFVGRAKFGTGGAFWAFHFVHPKTKKLICISGYVDAPPTTSWTHPLREVQAVLRSVRILE